MRPIARNTPPKMRPNVLLPCAACESNATVIEPIPIAVKIVGMISRALDPPLTSPPMTAVMTPPNTNRNHQPVPLGQYGTGP
jgi:hypothetical protein